jgi:prepilin-type N-terminal cleavage/methylation domain-containing protein
VVAVEQKSSRLPSANGFTILELMVSLLIIGLLAQLALPGVVASVESARRTKCINNVRQLALAALMHVDVHYALPSGGWSGHFIADPQRGFGPGQPGSWLYGVSPYLELKMPERVSPTNPYEHVLFSAELAALYTQAPEVFYCPSRRLPRPYPPKFKGNGAFRVVNVPGASSLRKVTKCDYAASAGDAVISASIQSGSTPVLWVPESYAAMKSMRLPWTPTSNRASSAYQSGVVFYRSRIGFAKVTDGCSSTYLVGEKSLPVSLRRDINAKDSPECLGDNQSAWVGYEWDNHRVAWNPRNGRPQRIFQPRSDLHTSGSSAYLAFGSAHTASFSMAFCDGSVRKISYEIDADVHRRQAVRDDQGS